MHARRCGKARGEPDTKQDECRKCLKAVEEVYMLKQDERKKFVERLPDERRDIEPK